LREKAVAAEEASSAIIPQWPHLVPGSPRRRSSCRGVESSRRRIGRNLVGRSPAVPGGAARDRYPPPSPRVNPWKFRREKKPHTATVGCTAIGKTRQSPVRWAGAETLDALIKAVKVIGRDTARRCRTNSRLPGGRFAGAGTSKAGHLVAGQRSWLGAVPVNPHHASEGSALARKFRAVRSPPQLPASAGTRPRTESLRERGMVHRGDRRCCKQCNRLSPRLGSL